MTQKPRKKKQPEASSSPSSPVDTEQESIPIHQRDLFRNAPPIWIWLIVLISAGAFFGFEAWRMSTEPQEPSDEADVAEIAAALAQLGTKAGDRRAAGKKLVVVIGTSLTQAAFFNNRRADAEVSRLGYPELQFFRIDQNGPLLVYRLIPLFEHISRAKPDAVLIENQVLTWHNQRENPGLLTAHRRSILSRLRTLFSVPEGRAFADPHGDAALDWKDHTEHFNSWSPQRQQARMAQLQSADELFKLKNRRAAWTGCPTEIPEPLRNFLNTAKTGHPQVMMLDIVTSVEARSVLPGRFVTCQKNLQDEVRKRFGVETIASPEMPDLGWFMDFTHFNRRGRIAFNEWLLPLLSRRLEKGETP